MEEKVVIALSDESADNTQSLRILEGEEEFEEESIPFGSDESQDVATDDDITNAELELGLDPLKA
jgi:hypothetical protein